MPEQLEMPFCGTCGRGIDVSGGAVVRQCKRWRGLFCASCYSSKYAACNQCCASDLKADAEAKSAADAQRQKTEHDKKLVKWCVYELLAAVALGIFTWAGFIMYASALKTQ